MNRPATMSTQQNEFAVRRRRLSAHALAVLLFLAFFACTDAANAQSVWGLTPYRICIVPIVDQPALSPEKCKELEDRVADMLTDRIESTIGGAWRVARGEVDTGLRRRLPGLLDDTPVGISTVFAPKQSENGSAALTRRESVEYAFADGYPKEWFEGDKVIFVVVRPDETGWTIVARDYDLTTRWMSPAVEMLVANPEKIASVLLHAVVESFAPVAVIETVEGDSVTLRRRASQLVVHASDYRPAAPGDIFVPIIRFDDRDGRPRRITTAAWTALLVESVDPAKLLCHQYSGVRSALSARRRGRTLQYAIRLRPTGQPTRLIALAPSDPPRPLYGYDLFECKVPLPGEDASETEPARYIGSTNRDGAIVIEPAEAIAMRLILVQNGNRPLARLPILTGIEPECTVFLPDDQYRLDAEGRLKSLEEELVDIVTQRQLLIARINKLVAEGKTDDANKVFKTLEDLKGRDQLLRELAYLETRTVADGDMMQKRIDAMYDKARELILEYINPREIDEVRNSIK